MVSRTASLLAVVLLALIETPVSSFQHGAPRSARQLARVRSLSVLTHPADRPSSRTGLWLTADGESSEANGPSHSKEDIATNYRRGKVVMAAAAAVVLALPDRSLSRLLAKKVGGASGFALASGLCHILEGANEHNRLGSDTYKRLNVGLLGFSVLGLMAVPGEAGFLFTAGPALAMSVALFLVRSYGAMVAYQGWERGVNPHSPGTNAFTELVEGAKSTFAGLKIQNRKKGLSYANLLLLVVASGISNLMDGIFNIRYLKTFHKTLFDVSLNFSAVSRLFMISTMIYSLKDAAERDRLTGTTFIQMNILVGMWAVWVAMGVAASPGPPRGLEMIAFSLPFFIKALKSQKEKQDKTKESSSEEKEDP